LFTPRISLSLPPSVLLQPFTTILSSCHFALPYKLASKMRTHVRLPKSFDAGDSELILIQLFISAVFLLVTAVAYPRQGLKHVDTSRSLPYRKAPHLRTPLEHGNILEVTVYLTTTIMLTESATSSLIAQPTDETVTVTVIKTLTGTIWETTTLDQTQSLSQSQHSSNTESATQNTVNTTSLPTPSGQNVSTFQTSPSTANSIATLSTVTISNVQSEMAGMNMGTSIPMSISQQSRSNQGGTAIAIPTLVTVTIQQINTIYSEISQGGILSSTPSLMIHVTIDFQQTNNGQSQSPGQDPTSSSFNASQQLSIPQYTTTNSILSSTTVGQQQASFHAGIAGADPNSAWYIDTTQQLNGGDDSRISSTVTIAIPQSNEVQGQISVSTHTSVNTNAQWGIIQGGPSLEGSTSSTRTTTISFVTASQSPEISMLRTNVQGSRVILGTNAGATLVVTPFLPPP
jgi:hypothetical protein